MQNKRLVRRVKGDSRPVWEACATEAATREHLVRRFVERVFDGSARRLVAHLLGSKDLSERERDEIRRLLDED
jgi:predicted transcriptional regulator